MADRGAVVSQFNHFPSSGPLALELLPLNGMLKRLGTKLLDLIDNMPLGWLGGPFRRMTPVPVRRSRSPYYR